MKQESVFILCPHIVETSSAFRNWNQQKNAQWAVVILKSVPQRLRHILGQKPVMPEMSQHWFSFLFNSHENATGLEGLCQILRMALSEP